LTDVSTKFRNPSVPALIKRNTVCIALSQAFTGAGMQMGYGIAPLMVVALSGSSSLAGMSVGLFAVSRFMVAYPVGKITDAYGRKPGIMLGLLLGLAGSLTLGLAMQNASLVGLAAGLLIMGMGLNAAQQLRVAAADMYPPSMRAQALGFVAAGSLLGLFIAPLLIAAGHAYGDQSGLSPLALPWLILPAFILLSVGIVFLIRPDPKEIGERLDQYYPGYKLSKPPAGAVADRFRAMSLIRPTRTRLAIAANTAAQANMSMVMVLTSLMLDHHGHSLAAIGFSHAFHSAGMFAFTIPLGRAADRFGRERVMYPGVVLTIIGAGLITLSQGFWGITLGTFLVGLGWAAANVAATAIIADAATTSQRGRAIGVNDSFAAAAALTSALITGPLIQWYGLTAAGAAATLFALVPLLMWLASARTARRA
jgi:MFS family permease